MYLQNIVKISASEAKLLSRVIAKQNFLLTLKDSNFLCNDLIAFPSYRKDKKGKRIGPVDLELGKYVSPDFELSTVYGFNRYVYRQTRTPGWKQNLSFLCGPVPDGILYGDGVHIYVMAGKGNNIQVQLGGFLDPQKDKEGLIWNRTIARIASYFHNRKAVYLRIQELLLGKKEEFAANTSETFINDLLPLFSVENIVEESCDFKLDFNQAVENLIRDEKIKVPEDWKLVGKMCHFVERDYAAPFEFETAVWLAENNALIFNIFRKTEYYGNNNEYTIAKAFITCNASDFLNQLVASTNFGMALYDNVKAKIFLNTI